MRNQTLVVVGAALITAAVVVVVALVAFNVGSNRNDRPAAQPGTNTSTSTSTATATRPSAHRAHTKPAPTVTVTKHQAPPTVVAPPQPQFGSDDEDFLSLIAADGIKAPDDWAIKAGRATCGRSYDFAYSYLTDGGLHGDHVQTFLDDWIATHGGC